jgi:glutamate formiminotransferase / formiminotetrahydrofolate cyclodeaminase
MHRQIIECVANFSEGRNQAVMDHIATAISRVNGVKIINIHSDIDHNRSVISFIGSPDTIAEAAFTGIKTAAEQIDMNQHQGQHPRIGAADVVPFIPIQDVTMAECVAVAHAVGKRVGEQLHIPVYFYEEAAMHSSRRNLADVRRGEYETLKQAIITDESYRPDYGPADLGKEGAVAIGARKPLIAFNVYLNTDNIDVARRIAETIRHSSGGLRHVKALGLLVDGRAQVSMNITDYANISLAQIVEFIRREAQRYGVMVERSELVGLIPLQALIDAAKWSLQLDNLQVDHVLEMHLLDLD